MDAGKVPADIRKACMILGLKPGELTREAVMTAWQTQSRAAGAPSGSDSQAFIYLNKAKDDLLLYLNRNSF
ncbi:MAG TPA: hypothetical protein V6C81_31400 [Planktothrix sp.]|jgi:hypothetical protein